MTVRFWRESSAPQRRIVLGVLVVGALLASWVAADYWQALPRDAQASYVGRDACRSCHQPEFDRFVGSHHDLAMDIATDESVLGDFGDVIFEHDGLQNRLYREGSKFMVRTEGESGQMEDFEVKYVFGVDPLQNYMVEFDRPENAAANEIGRLQVLRITWDTHRKRWFYLRPPDVPEKLEPGDPLHWTGVAQRWQTMCADCHSTNLQRNFDLAELNYHTTFSEIDVGCESCHGPGSLHIELANRRSLFWDRHVGYGLAKLKGSDPTTQLETCAPCHSRRGVLDATFRPGDSYHDFYNLELLRADTYHDDGQIKDEVYVFGSFTQSKMYHKGIRCTDCHDPHSLQLKHPGNETCTSCHQHAAGKYDVPSHHHHAVGSEAAQCVNCHMPHTTYMEVDARRDHSLRVPRPDLSVKIGTPNACSSCHVRDHLGELSTEQQAKLPLYQNWLDASANGDSEIAEIIAKTDRWCDEACEKWYGEGRQTPSHYGEILHGLRTGDQASIAKAMRLVTDPGDDVTPALARATALDELAATNPRQAILTAQRVLRLQNQSPLLRATAARVMSQADPRTAASRLLPLIEEDPSRLVRSEAVRALIASGGFQTLSGSTRKLIDSAIDIVGQELMAAPDRAGSHMGWAMLCEQRGDVSDAVTAYENAIRVEPEMTGPRTNLAAFLEQLKSAQDRPEVASMITSLLSNRTELDGKTLEDWITRLRKAELPRLARDAQLAEDNAELHYRYGLALYLDGQFASARDELRRAVELAPQVEVFGTALRLLDERLNQSL